MLENDVLPSPDFQRIRDALKIPREFSAAVLAEAANVAHRNPLNYRALDLQSVPFITIDPPSSLDLDQAFFATRHDDGYEVKYAIDDVGYFVDRGSVIEQAAWTRGTTVYSPDIKTPLYPPILSEGAASLLPDVPRPAIVFDFTLNSRAEFELLTITRAIIRSRAKLAYPDVSEHLAAERNQPGSGPMNGHEWSGSLPLLEEIGRKRQRLEIERNAINLKIPAQQVERWTTALYGYRLAFEEASDVEEWNAQISLMTGMAAAMFMISHSVGLLRALEAPRPEKLMMLRLTAQALGVNWSPEMEYADFVRSLDNHNPAHAVMLHQAAKLNGGARYVAFEGAVPKHGLHFAIASPYAHVTAPLRRLADRYVLDLLVALAEGTTPAPELIETLFKLPPVMNEAERISRQLESEIVDFAEARLMQDHIGETFKAMVIGLREEGLIVQITEPPIRTLIPATIFAPETTEKPQTELLESGTILKINDRQIRLGQILALKLIAADTKSRTLSFALE